MNSKQLLLAIAIAGALIFSSCLKETIEDLSGIKGAKVENEFSLPLVSVSLGMKELYETHAKSAFIHEDANQLLIFSYQGTDSVEPKQYVEIPSMPFNYNLQMPAPVIAAFNFNNRFDLVIDSGITLPTSNNEQIKRIKVKEGNFIISVTNSFKHNAQVAISYPGISKNGVSFTDTITLPYNPSESPKTITHTFTIDGYDIDFSNGGTTFNYIPFGIGVSLVRIPSNPTSTSDFLGINQTFNIASYSQVNGYLGKFNIINAHQNQGIDLLSGQLAGDILVNDPRLVLKVLHSYGLPVTGKISNIKVITEDSQELLVTIQPFKDTFSFVQPTIPGQVAVSEYVISKLNSNLDDVLNSRPTSVEYDIDFFSNYNEIITDNFLVDNALFKTEIDFQLPMDIKILDYSIEEKTALSIGEIDLKGAEHVKLAVKTENTLPFDMFAQMLFAKDSIINGDTVNIVIDSLFNSQLVITGAVVDQDGKVVSPYISISEVSLPVKRFDKISKEAQYSIMRIRSQSSQFNGTPGFVKIYTNQKMTMKLGGKIKLILKSNEPL